MHYKFLIAQDEASRIVFEKNLRNASFPITEPECRCDKKKTCKATLRNYTFYEVGIKDGAAPALEDWLSDWLPQNKKLFLRKFQFTKKMAINILWITAECVKTAMLRAMGIRAVRCSIKPVRGIHNVRGLLLAKIEEHPRTVPCLKCGQPVKESYN